MHIHWKNQGQPHQGKQTEAWSGKSEHGELIITVLPPSVVYRQPCGNESIDVELVHSYYIWHYCGLLSEDGKLVYASKVGLWHLREDWEMITRAISAVGKEWLKLIAIL